MNTTAPRVLHIAGEFNIYRAEELKQALLAALADTPALDIDLSGVLEIDTVGVQLLMLAKKIAQANRCTVRLVAHSAAVTEVFELLNLAAYFGDPLVIASRDKRSPPSAAGSVHES